MSAKTSAQPGRRTPLSLSGAVTKSQPNKGSNNIANGGGNNANGHQASSSNKQDNKSQQQKTDQPVVNNLETKDNPNKRQQTQPEKKPQPYENKKSYEKNQNGVGSNKQQETNENKQQNKEKVQQPNRSDDNKSNEKEKKEKSEKPDKSENPKEKPEKDITKSKEDKKEELNMSGNKKEEKKIKESKDSKEDKNKGSTQSDEITETQQQIKGDDTKAKDEDIVKSVEKKLEEKVVEIEDQKQQKSSNSATSKNNSKANRTSTPVNKTPTKLDEKTLQKSPTVNSVKTTPVTKREVTTTIDDNDVDMEPLAFESSPVKSLQKEVANIKTAPSATSTPGKLHLPKLNLGATISDVQLAMQAEISPERPRMFSQISGRKSIRPISDYTPSKFQSNLQFRESYRRINTELDVTNTSMNVTVGSEVPSNFSFSFFGRGRKRDRTPPPHSQSAIGELQTDIDISPPKKARLDMNGLFSVVSSPLALLRNRFSKTSLQSSTPVKLQQKLNEVEDEIEVQNVSGVSVHEEIEASDKEPAEKIDNNDATFGEEAEECKFKTDTALSSPIEVNAEGKEFKDVSIEKSCVMEQFEQSDIKVIETPLHPAVGDPMAKNKKCVVM